MRKKIAIEYWMPIFAPLAAYIILFILLKFNVI